VLALRWKRAAPALSLRWSGPDQVTLEALADNPATPVAAIIGPAGADGAPALKHGFSYGDATPYGFATVPAGKTVQRCRVIIDVPFNGAGATLSVGTAASPQLLMPQGGLMLSEAGIYETSLDLAMLSATQLMIFITPGAGAIAGSGRVLIEHS
jgi:hypothetical protein